MIMENSTSLVRKYCIKDQDNSDSTIIDMDIENIMNKYNFVESTSASTTSNNVIEIADSDSNDSNKYINSLNNVAFSFDINNYNTETLNAITPSTSNMVKLTSDCTNPTLYTFIDDKIINNCIELSSDEDLPTISLDLNKKRNPTPISDEDLNKKYKMRLNSEENIFEKHSSMDKYPNSPKKKKVDTTENTHKNIEKINKKVRKQDENDQAKKLKQVLASSIKNMKPEECMKFMTVLIDNKIMEEKYSSEILNALQSTESAYQLVSQVVPYTISWTRKIQHYDIDSNKQLMEKFETIETDEVLLLINWNEMVELVNNQMLLQHIESIKTLFVGKSLSLGIYGLENYFKYQKYARERNMRDDINLTQSHKNKYDKIYADIPKIDAKQLEFALTELQILYSCCHRLIETPHDLAAIITQFTKSIAQAPYKLEKQQKQQEMQRYVCGDNKDCVQVDKNGNGIQRLWQQQLTTFPMARLEHAEAIIVNYPTLPNLMQKYDSISKEQGEKLLQDIPIRRAAGPLSSVRKIGPELSKKIYTFFNSVNENVTL